MFENIEIVCNQRDLFTLLQKSLKHDELFYDKYMEYVNLFKLNVNQLEDLISIMYAKTCYTSALQDTTLILLNLLSTDFSKSIEKLSEITINEINKININETNIDMFKKIFAHDKSKNVSKFEVVIRAMLSYLIDNDVDNLFDIITNNEATIMLYMISKLICNAKKNMGMLIRNLFYYLFDHLDLFSAEDINIIIDIVYCDYEKRKNKEFFFPLFKKLTIESNKKYLVSVIINVSDCVIDDDLIIKLTGDSKIIEQSNTESHVINVSDVQITNCDDLNDNLINQNMCPVSDIHRKLKEANIKAKYIIKILKIYKSESVFIDMLLNDLKWSDNMYELIDELYQKYEVDTRAKAEEDTW